MTTRTFARAGLIAATLAAAVGIATPSMAQERSGWNTGRGYTAYDRSDAWRPGYNAYGSAYDRGPANVYGYNGGPYSQCFTDDGYGRYRSCDAADSN
jgi:hypothetical protein